MSDTTPTYAAGELVDITIKAARVLPCDVDGVLAAEYTIRIPEGEGRWRRVSVCTDSDSVTVERVAPAEWPPHYKQIWQDSDGDLWTMTRLAHPDRVSYRLTCADSSKGSGIYSPAELLERYGPLELIHDANPPADTEDGES